MKRLLLGFKKVTIRIPFTVLFFLMNNLTEITSPVLSDTQLVGSLEPW